MRKYKGEVLDYAVDPKTGERKLIHHGHNIVVDSASTLIACLMKGQSGMGGIQYFAVGRGSSNWSNEQPPMPDAVTSRLVAESFRKKIKPENIVFITTDNEVSETPTNRLQITVMFEEEEANGELRELGIFGGNATAMKDSGLMINCKIHPLIYKTNGMKLERIIRFTF